MAECTLTPDALTALRYFVRAEVRGLGWRANAHAIDACKAIIASNPHLCIGAELVRELAKNGGNT